MDLNKAVKDLEKEQVQIKGAVMGVKGELSSISESINALRFSLDQHFDTMTVDMDVRLKSVDNHIDNSLKVFEGRYISKDEFNKIVDPLRRLVWFGCGMVGLTILMLILALLVP
jgi:hypothetical protein